VSSRLQNALETLYGLERRRSDFRVEDTRRLLDALGGPDRRFRAVHVAGTNGKGSACALVERVLRAAGFRTGLYTSPHLVDFRERIRVSGCWLAEDELDARLEAVRSLPEAAGRTFFEVATALGFDAFGRHGVEWAVVEVGLGGRLDATNALDSEVAVVTSIGHDHTEVLGRDDASIAREKAAIARRGRPLVSGVPAGGAAAAAIAGVAAAVSARLVEAASVVSLADVRTSAGGSRFTAIAPPWGRMDLGIGLRGRHQVDNAAVALAALATLAATGVAVPAPAVRDGFAAARWPGRLEPCPAEPRLWWDGAHNLQGIERLCAAWTEDLGFEPPRAVVFAAARDKDAAALLGRLHALAPGAHLRVAGLHHDRALTPAGLLAAAAAAGWPARAHEEIGSAVRDALGVAKGGRVLLAGSLFAVGEAMREFSGAPGACE
jgi:dihydrofolate synthase/folylpolyglutamate synthase